MKSFLRILRYARKYWVYALLNIISNLASIIFSLGSFAMVVPFLQLLFGQVKLVDSNPGFSLSIDGVLNYFNFEFSKVIIQSGKEEALVFLSIGVVILFFV